MMKLRYVFYSLLIVVLAVSCREDDIIIYPSEHSIGEVTHTKYAGLYVLNEGNMGSNKATLDFLDLDSGKYYRNIYPSRNPNQIKELGDVGNDVKIYGNSLWLVINQSNKVEVANARTAVSRGHVDIPNCRYVAFQGRYAYVSSYVGKISEKSVLGAVYKVDTASLQIVDKCTVGYQPEELVVQDGKIYVANSGGYNGMSSLGYDRTVSIIDLNTFTVTKTIDVGVNLFHIRNDKYGKLWVSSRGDYNQISSNLYVVDNDRVEDALNMPVDGFDIIGDSLVTYTTQNMKPVFKVVDIRTRKVVNSNFLKIPEQFPIKTAYGIIIHPITGDIYVMDATNYVSSGKLYCFDKNGNYKWHTLTGDIPGHACFLINN
ncbi:YncE family protein [Prevotella pallens]|uniref:YncE family protein n=1 Tax=Prevotella pallens TaxID=60133 RepID=UPI0035CEAE90